MANGSSQQKAENTVLEVLKDCHEDLISGNYKLVIATLEMIFWMHRLKKQHKVY